MLKNREMYMKNQEGLERIVLYKTEQALQNHLAWYKTHTREKCENSIEMILYRALNSYGPWVDFCMDGKDVKGFFYSNALACALLTFKYLSAGDTTVEEIVCEEYETVEKNKALKLEIQDIKKYCDRFYIGYEKWEKDIKKRAGVEESDEDGNKIIEDYLRTAQFSYTYIPFSKEKITDFLLPLVKKIVEEIKDERRTETIDYKMMRVLQLYIEHMDGRKPADQWHEWLDDDHENPSQRQRKSRLLKEYDAFCEKLFKIRNEPNAYECYSEYMMAEFAKEMIYHGRAVMEFEEYITGLKNISRTMDTNILEVIKSDVYRHVMNLYFKCDVPVVFGADGLIFLNKEFSRNRYVEFLGATIRGIYDLAGEDAQKAYDISKKYVDEIKRPSCNSLKPLDVRVTPSDQKKCRIFAIGQVLAAISQKDPYRVDTDMLSRMARVI